MAAAISITGDNKHNDSFSEKNSSTSSSSSINELTEITLKAVANKLNDYADSGFHKNWTDTVIIPKDGVHIENDNVMDPKESEDLIEKNDFWMTHRCFGCMKNVCKPCLRSEKEDPVPITVMEKLKYSLLCPPAGFLAEALLRIILLLALWGVMWSISGSSAEPGGNLFALFILWIIAAIFGEVFDFCKLPGLLGMLIAGFVLKNVPYIKIAEDIDPKWSSIFRGIALVVILIRAGLGLDPGALKKLSFVCVRLAFLPCLSEAITVMVASNLIFNFPWLWGLMLGFVLAAVSPAVVVPCLLSLSDRSYGTAKGIPTLVIASASIDDVLAIGGFGVVLAITFSTGDLVVTILQGPIEVLIGVVYGSFIGILLWFLPNKTTSRVAYVRSCLVFCTSVFAVLGSRAFNFAGSGPLACLILSFIAAMRWRKEDKSTLESIKSTFTFLWFIFQPFLFALIGAEIAINSLKLNVIGYGVATLVCGLIIRILVSYLAVLGANFTWKERLFVALAWLPKATVQAAIGPIALDYARDKGEENYSKEIEFGTQILAIAVLAIMITAPIGAALIVLTGTKLLTYDGPVTNNKINGNQEIESSNTNL